jgi:hypothetical protein
MKQRLTAAGLSAVAALSIAACGQLNRTATLNQTTKISGASAAAALQRQLANKGFSSASVSCAKTITVIVGVTITCSVTGAGPNGTVRFTIGNLSGKIDPGSVKTGS